MMLGKMVWFEQFFGKDSKYTALVNEAEDFDLEKTNFGRSWGASKKLL